MTTKTTKQKQKHKRTKNKTKKQTKLSGNPIRNIGFLAWRNNAAALETMRGSKWRSAIRREKRFYNQLLSPKIRKMATVFEKELQTAGKLSNMESFSIGCGSIFIMTGIGSSFTWRWAWSNKQHLSSDIDYFDSKVYFITADEKDKYASNLTCQTADGHNVWTKKGVSGQVAVINGLCYYVNVAYPFNTTEVVCCDAYTGKNLGIVLKDPYEDRFLGFVRASGSQLYCKSTTWMDGKTWRIEGRRAVPFMPETRNQVPLGSHKGCECALIMKHGSNEWIPHGAFLKSWIMPPGSIQWVNVASGHTITNDKGRQTLYLCAPHKRPVQIHHIAAGDFEPSPWNKWFDQPFQSFMIRTPEEHPYVFYAASNSTVHKKWRPPFDKKVAEDFGTFKSTLHKAKSADGTEVSYLMVHLEKVKPKAILCYVYSAYGMSTIVGWPHIGWGPLLRRGFAIVYCYARGGGDNDFAWMEAGQREKHIRTVEDFEATIQAAQKLVHVGPDKTIIFGRSAGGMMVGATTARHPDGDLMGATFTEVPFVDVLRTSTNPKLPLTTSGTSEYGNIERSPVNFQAALELSPMDTLPPDGAPGVFVLSRTGLRDLQVMPFEPVKFIERLRGARQTEPQNKFLGIEDDETHSYSSKTFVNTRAQDLAILLDWAKL